MAHPVLAIAKGEILRSRNRFRPRNILVAVALSALLALPASVRPTAELYTLSVEGSPDLEAAAAADGRFLLVSGPADVTVRSDQIVPAPTDKGEAALQALAQAARSHKVQVLRATGDPRAFPVEVDVHFLERAPPAFFVGGAAPTPAPAPTPQGPVTLPRLQQGGTPSLLPPARFVATPAELQPPLPFGAMLLSFLFLFPGYFAAQLGSSTVFAEKVRRQGEPLFVAPVKPWHLMAGKMLPLGLAAAGLMAVESAGLFRSPDALPAFGLVLPLLAFLLAASLLAGVLARSHPELTGLTLMLTVAGSVLLLVPTLFLDVSPAAAASPFSPVVRLLEGTPPSAMEVLGPLLLLGALTASLLLLARPLLEPELFFARLAPSKRLGEALRRCLGEGSAGRFAAAGLLLAPPAFWPFLGFGPLLAVAPPLLFAALLLMEVAKGAPVVASGSRGLAAPLRGAATGLGLGSGAALLALPLSPGGFLLALPALHGATGGLLGLGLGALGKRGLLPLALASAGVQWAAAQVVLGAVRGGLHV